MACSDCDSKLAKYTEEKNKLVAAIQQLQNTLQQYVRRLDMVNGALEVLETETAKEEIVAQTAG